MKQNIPVILIIASILLIILNIVTTDEFDNGFWMQTLSGALVILAMLVTIRNRKTTN
tara:strand:- start:2505 stop:2675 length:171 start_codon:yes stop_codon:yes gene_type:complete